MSPNEIFVLEALQSIFGGNYSKGEDPPDGYLAIDKHKIAVEVTRLIQKVKNEQGKYVSRFEHDIPALKLTDDINEKIFDKLPDSKYVFIVISSPIDNIRKTKAKLISEILTAVSESTVEKEVVIEGNRISIAVNDGTRESGKKVIGAVANRYSSANIHENSKDLLRDRILSKVSKCKITEEVNEYWLALYNDYWLADIESYRRAYRELDINHNFNKILIVDSYGQVEEF